MMYVYFFLTERADSDGILVTPWFKLIVENFLYPWWNKLDHIDSQADRETIHRMV